MKERTYAFSRTPEELIKFSNLVRTLIWVQRKAQKSPAEVVSLTLRRGKHVLSKLD